MKNKCSCVDGNIKIETKHDGLFAICKYNLHTKCSGPTNELILQLCAWYLPSLCFFQRTYLNLMACYLLHCKVF